MFGFCLWTCGYAFNSVVSKGFNPFSQYTELIRARLHQEKAGLSRQDKTMVKRKQKT